MPSNTAQEAPSPQEFLDMESGEVEASCRQYSPVGKAFQVEAAGMSLFVCSGHPIY